MPVPLNSGIFLPRPKHYIPLTCHYQRCIAGLGVQGFGGCSHDSHWEQRMFDDESYTEVSMFVGGMRGAQESDVRCVWDE
jgi:hypothetical protein